MKQIKAFFVGFFNTDDSIITNIMKEQNTRILMLVDLKLKPSILGGVMFTTSSGSQEVFIYYLLTDPSRKLSQIHSTIEHDGKLVGKGLGQILLRIVSGVLFTGCSISLLCAEEKLEYYKRLGFKEIEFEYYKRQEYHENHEFVRKCCEREGFYIERGNNNSVNLYPLELKGSLQFSEIGNIFRMVTRWCESIPKFELVINPQTVSQKFSKESTKITKDYWLGVQQAKSTTKIRMHNLSVYIDYWIGRTKNNYSKFSCLWQGK